MESGLSKEAEEQVGVQILNCPVLLYPLHCSRKDAFK